MIGGIRISLIVAVKNGDKVTVACDTQLTSGGVKKLGLAESGHKVWHPNDYEDVVMGSSGTVREGCLMRTNSIIDELVYKNEGINFKYIVNDLVSNMRELVKDEPDQEDTVGKLGNSYILAVRDKIYHIFKDGAVLEVNDYTAIGSGANEAMASLSSTEELDIDERIEKAMIAGARNDVNVSFPVIVKTTDSIVYQVIE